VELVVALDRLEDVKYHTAFNSDFIGLAHACLCAGKGGLLHAAALSLDATKVRKNVNLFFFPKKCQPTGSRVKKTNFCPLMRPRCEKVSTLKRARAVDKEYQSPQ
jgi:hypothetical protein